MEKNNKYDLALEAAMQLVPYVGGSLSTLYFGNKQEKRFKRLEAFYSELRVELTKLGSKIPDISSHGADELASILEKLHDGVESEHIQIKRECYKSFYMHTLLDPINTKNYDERMLYLLTLERLNEIMMQIFFFILQQTTPVIDKNINKEGTSPALVQGAISQLKMLGLVDSKLHNIVISTNSSVNEHVEISSFGKAFHSFCMT